MTDYQNIILDVEDGVATITLNRPEKLNTISAGLRNDLEAALREVRLGSTVRVVRIRGAGRALPAPASATPPCASPASRRRSGCGRSASGSTASIPTIRSTRRYSRSANAFRWFEIAGIRTAIWEGAEFDAACHESPSIHEFLRISRKQGLKSALAWRDTPFGNDSGVKPPRASARSSGD